MISTTALGQAAAEYVGVLLRSAAQTVSSVGNELLAFAKANPWALLVGVIALIALWSMVSRR